MNKITTKCEHYWHYEHTVWQSKPNNGSVVAVGRYCSKCGKMQSATASKWRSLPDYVDMREVLEKSLATL